MFGRSPQEKYNKYLEWFEDHVNDPANWSWMRKDRDCCNWHDQHSRPEPYAFGEAQFLMSDPRKMRKMMDRKIETNHKRYGEMGKYINGDPKQGTINPEYLARFENTKKLREHLKTYGGSDEFASDELFRLKEEADAQGKDFSQVAYNKIKNVRGENVEMEVAPIDIPEYTPEPVEELSWWEKILQTFGFDQNHRNQFGESFLEIAERKNYEGYDLPASMLRSMHEAEKKKRRGQR